MCSITIFFVRIVVVRSAFLARRAIAERVANMCSIREFFVRIVVGGSAFLEEV